MYYWQPYVNVATRRLRAARETARLRRLGRKLQPVVVARRAIAASFWGKAWCDNLERYSDYANRLPRGRTYVRNGSVLDLRIRPGEVEAVVSGSRIYEVKVSVSPVPAPRWRSLARDCTGAVDSLVELLQGRFSRGTMERICRQRTGLFPSPDEIRLACSCPDWAVMCKHVAAVLYGIGARLDQSPGLLFTLRKVDGNDLVSAAATAGRPSLTRRRPAAGRILNTPDLSAIFGLELSARGASRVASSAEPARARRRRGPGARPAARRRAKA